MNFSAIMAHSNLSSYPRVSKVSLRRRKSKWMLAWITIQEQNINFRRWALSNVTAHQITGKQMNNARSRLIWWTASTIQDSWQGFGISMICKTNTTLTMQKTEINSMAIRWKSDFTVLYMRRVSHETYRVYVSCHHNLERDDR